MASRQSRPVHKHEPDRIAEANKLLAEDQQKRAKQALEEINATLKRLRVELKIDMHWPANGQPTQQIIAIGLP